MKIAYWYDWSSGFDVYFFWCSVEVWKSLSIPINFDLSINTFSSTTWFPEFRKQNCLLHFRFKPAGHSDAENFSWERYLEETSSLPVPARSFKAVGSVCVCCLSLFLSLFFSHTHTSCYCHGTSGYSGGSGWAQSKGTHPHPLLIQAPPLLYSGFVTKNLSVWLTSDISLMIRKGDVQPLPFTSFN